MAIFDEKRMKQKEIYPTKQTPSYADWALFEMGKELEESGSGGVEYTAGSGISISEENVISNSAQPDVNKAYVDGVDLNLQQQIDAVVASSDVKDIVGTYAELQAYDTTTLGNNDIVKVLVDSTHNDAMGYYRWVITEGVGAWTYIGSEGPYYTKSQTDALLNDKLEDDFSNADVGQATAGQVLTVNSSANGVEFANVPKELPVIVSGDAGKVLQVNAGETGVEWDSVNEVPNPTSADTNKVLTATGANAFGWAEVAGGSESYDIVLDLYEGEAIYINNESVDVATLYSTLESIVYSTKLYHIEVGYSGTSYSAYFKNDGTGNGYDIISYVKKNDNNIFKCNVKRSALTIDSTYNTNLNPRPTSSDVNKVLSVDSNIHPVWRTTREVPAPTSSDANKVLTATGVNAFAWMTAGGGSGGVTKKSISSKTDTDLNTPGNIFVGGLTYNSQGYFGVGYTTSGPEGEHGMSGIFLSDNGTTLSNLGSFYIDDVSYIEGYLII